MSEIKLENVNKLKRCSKKLGSCASNIKNEKNNLNSQISSLNLDTKDMTNQAIYRKVEQIKFNIDDLTKILSSMSNEAQAISAKLSIMK